MEFSNKANRIINIIFVFLICIISLNASGQTYTFDGQGNLIGGSHIRTKPGEPVKLIDSLTNNYFILDSAHIEITAYDKTGNMIWKTNPHKDNALQDYRTKNPFIVNFSFMTDHWCSGKNKVISISYINSQFGYLELKTGNFHFCGQD
jgi:hypothetical protein